MLSSFMYISFYAKTQKNRVGTSFIIVVNLLNKLVLYKFFQQSNVFLSIKVLFIRSNLYNLL